jgi:hypothetical protein
MNKLFCAVLLSAGLLTVGPAAADSALDTGNYVIHYNTLSTDLLQPDIAKVYGIQRSKNRAMLNVTVVRKGEGTGETVPAEVTASATNLNGQLRKIDLRKVTDQNAIYYIGEFPVSDGETLDFSVSVKPEGGDQRIVEFRKEFFTD